MVDLRLRISTTLKLQKLEATVLLAIPHWSKELLSIAIHQSIYKNPQNLMPHFFWQPIRAFTLERKNNLRTTTPPAIVEVIICMPAWFDISGGKNRPPPPPSSAKLVSLHAIADDPRLAYFEKRNWNHSHSNLLENVVKFCSPFLLNTSPCSMCMLRGSAVARPSR